MELRYSPHIQPFTRLREEKRIYVDKTELIDQLAVCRSKPLRKWHF